MLEDIAAQLKIYLGLTGAYISGVMGILARSAYSNEEFSWRTFWAGTCFAMFIAVLAGGVGEYFGLPAIVVYALAGTAGYLGPQFLSGWLRNKVGEDAGDEDDENP